MTAAKHASPEESFQTVYGRVFDENNQNWQNRPEYNKVFVQCQMNWANDKLQARGHIFLNEIYDSLSMPRSSAGALVGWVKGSGDSYVDFGPMDMDEAGRIALEFNVDGVIYDKIEN
jgi:hypothetical protein